jgi:hypothetical protein
MDQMLSWRPTVQQRSKLATPLSVTATEKKLHPAFSTTCRSHPQSPPNPPATLKPGNAARSPGSNAPRRRARRPRPPGGRKGRIVRGVTFEIGFVSQYRLAPRLASFRNLGGRPRHWFRSVTPLTSMCWRARRSRLRPNIGFVSQPLPAPQLASYRNLKGKPGASSKAIIEPAPAPRPGATVAFCRTHDWRPPCDFPP